MTVYRHYKNKPYRFLDIVRHSETQEDLVLYETLYENAGGKLWVRPKPMFFETVNVEGVSKPRFAKAELDVKTFDHFTEEAQDAVNHIGKLCFDTWSPEDLETRTRGKTKLHIAIGYFDQKPVAFKVGYEISHEIYYS